MNRFAKQIFFFLRAIALDPRKIKRAFPEVIHYCGNLFRFRREFVAQIGDTPVIPVPILFQSGIKSGFDAHYVYQSAWAIRRIRESGVTHHVDISSNIPYVAALSSVVDVEFFEFRPPQIELRGLSAKRGDILDLPIPVGSVKSLSCLHVLEHIGLGRYGDPILADGTRMACEQLAKRVALGGNLFVSLPIGRRRVEFNAHRVLDPRDLVEYFGSKFKLKEFCVVTDDGRYIEAQDPAQFSKQEYACGLYWFEKLSS